MNKLAIVVTTCDAFSDLWVNNITLFDKYWANHPPIYLVSDKPNDLSKKLDVHFIYSNQDYAYRLRDTLKQIDAEYIFLTLDDYLLSDYVDVNRLIFLVNYMEDNKISYMRFFKRTLTKGWADKREHIHLLPLTKKTYEVNLYPSIWKKDDLMKMFVNDESPWKFEVRLTRRARENNLYCTWVNNKKVLPFVDTIRKGKYLRKAYRFLKKNNLFISERKVRTIRETLSLNVRTQLGRHLPKKIKNYLKSKSHKEFYSDYYATDD